MPRAVVFALALCVGCSGPLGAAAPDAPSPDAPGCPSTTVFTPVTVTGTSPAGSLDGFRFASAGFVDGFCPQAYLVNFTTAATDPTCTTAPWLQLAISAPFTTGTNAASATLPNSNDHTDQVSFEATRLDPPDAMPAHITGHFVSHDAAWSFDIPVDLTSQSSSTCL